MSTRERFVHYGFCVCVLAAALAGCGDDDGKGYIETVLSAKDVAERTACKMQLRGLSTRLTQYAAAHRGEFPASLKDLDLLANDTRCPGVKARPYVYVAGKTTQSTPGDILLYEAEPAHGPNCNVLTVDGTVKEMTPDELSAALNAN